ncbi:MAG: hypothetical protein N2748_04535, partial [candidate division WOR-3 bacterium]|nr:hypothetical protein [candidate division WOR-3 bacterium]
MKKVYIYLLLGILAISSAYAVSDNAGQAVVSPFEISITARQTGVGEAFTAYYDCNSYLYNPASLALLEYEFISATHNRWIAGSSQSYLSMGLPFNWGFLSAGLIYFK